MSKSRRDCACVHTACVHTAGTSQRRGRWRRWLAAHSCGKGENAAAGAISGSEADGRHAHSSVQPQPPTADCHVCFWHPPNNSPPPTRPRVQLHVHSLHHQLKPQTILYQLNTALKRQLTCALCPVRPAAALCTKRGSKPASAIAMMNSPFVTGEDSPNRTGQRC